MAAHGRDPDGVVELAGHAGGADGEGCEGFQGRCERPRRGLGRGEAFAGGQSPRRADEGRGKEGAAGYHVLLPLREKVAAEG